MIPRRASTRPADTESPAGGLTRLGIDTSRWDFVVAPASSGEVVFSIDAGRTWSYIDHLMEGSVPMGGFKDAYVADNGQAVLPMDNGQLLILSPP